MNGFLLETDRKQVYITQTKCFSRSTKNNESHKSAHQCFTLNVFHDETFLNFNLQLFLYATRYFVLIPPFAKYGSSHCGFILTCKQCLFIHNQKFSLKNIFCFHIYCVVNYELFNCEN